MCIRDSSGSVGGCVGFPPGGSCVAEQGGCGTGGTSTTPGIPNGVNGTNGTNGR